MPFKKTPRSDALYIRGVPKVLKVAFKKQCERDHISMVEAQARFLRLVTARGSPLWQELLRQPPVGREYNRE